MFKVLSDDRLYCEGGINNEAIDIYIDDLMDYYGTFDTFLNKVYAGLYHHAKWLIESKQVNLLISYLQLTHDRIVKLKERASGQNRKLVDPNKGSDTTLTNFLSRSQFLLLVSSAANEFYDTIKQKMDAVLNAFPELPDDGYDQIQRLYFVESTI